MQGMARALRQVRDALTLEYGHEKVPKPLAMKYTYCAILGRNGPVHASSITLGLVLFAPNTTCPRHLHKDIGVSYISVGDAWSEKNAAVYARGLLILNKANSRASHHHGQTLSLHAGL